MPSVHAVSAFKFGGVHLKIIIHQRNQSNLARGLGPSKYNLFYFMFLIDESNKEIVVHAFFVLPLDHVAISPIFCCKTRTHTSDICHKIGY